MTRITLLTKPDCDLCEHAKDVLRRVAGDTAIDIVTVDLESERGRTLAEASGMAFPPGVLIGDDPFSHGRLSERKLRKELARRAAET